jgi:hypothetical protein
MSLLPGIFGTGLKCGLFHAELDAITKYNALSYVWGLHYEDEDNKLLVVTETFTIK